MKEGQGGGAVLELPATGALLCRAAPRLARRRPPPSCARCPPPAQVSIRSLGEYFQTDVFEPAGLNATFYDLSLGQGGPVRRRFVWNGGYSTPIVVSAGGPVHTGCAEAGRGGGLQPVQRGWRAGCAAGVVAPEACGHRRNAAPCRR